MRFYSSRFAVGVIAIGLGLGTGQAFAAADGTLNNGESGLSNWTVYQDFNNNSTFDPQVVNTFAAASPILFLIFCFASAMSASPHG